MFVADACSFHENNLLLTCLDFHLLGLDEINKLYPFYLKKTSFTLPIISLAQFLSSVQHKRASTTSICTMGFCSRATKYAFMYLRFSLCYYENLMVED
jgi:hypothetical protein